MEFSPASHSIADRYRLLIGCIVPRPIAIVGTVSPDGKAMNLAPFSFFTGCGSDPMSLLFCPSNRQDGSEKDSLRNAKPISQAGQGEFTVSVCSEAVLRRALIAAEELPYGSSEFALSGLTPRPSSRVLPPGVAESPVTLECRTTQVIRLAPGRVGGGNIVVGEVVHMFIDDSVLDASGRIDPEALRAVGRMGGFEYCTTDRRISLPLGLAARDAKEPFV